MNAILRSISLITWSHEPVRMLVNAAIMSNLSDWMLHVMVCKRTVDT